MPSTKSDWDKLMRARIAQHKANDEKLTPWTAPIGPQPSGMSKHMQILMQSTPAAANPFSAGFGKTKKENVFKRIYKAFRQPWHKSPMVYFPYILIMAMEILLITTTKGDHTGSGIALGINAGICFMTWLNRQQKKMDERMDDIKRHIMEMEAEAKLRAEYEAKYGPV